MVDDTEFVKRRHLSRGRPRKYELGSVPAPPDMAAVQRHQPTAPHPNINLSGQRSPEAIPVQPALTLSDDMSMSPKKKPSKAWKKKLPPRSRRQSPPARASFNLDQQQKQQQRCRGNTRCMNRISSGDIPLSPIYLGLSDLTTVHSVSRSQHHNSNAASLGTEFSFGGAHFSSDATGGGGGAGDMMDC